MGLFTPPKYRVLCGALLPHKPRSTPGAALRAVQRPAAPSRPPSAPQKRAALPQPLPTAPKHRHPRTAKGQRGLRLLSTLPPPHPHLRLHGGEGKHPPEGRRRRRPPQTPPSPSSSRPRQQEDPARRQNGRPLPPPAAPSPGAPSEAADGGKASGALLPHKRDARQPARTFLISWGRCWRHLEPK